MTRGSALTFDPTILREYDIRGIIDKTLSADDAYAIGRAFGTGIARNGGKTGCVRYDGRLSSPDMEQAVVGGLRDCGLEAVRVGRGPTPMLYFAVNILNVDGGIIVLDSHNPPDYNDFKMISVPKPYLSDHIQWMGETYADSYSALGFQCHRVETLLVPSRDRSTHDH